MSSSLDIIKYYSEIIEMEIAIITDFVLSSTQKDLDEYQIWLSHKNAEY